MANKISKTEIKNIQKIYDVIKHNSRMTFSGIANKTKLTRQTVTKLFEKMEKSKLIWGYCAVVDSKKFGFNTYALLVKTKTSLNLEFKNFKNFLNEKTKKDENIDDMFIVYSGLFHGEYDWIILFLSKDLFSARRNIKKYLAGFEEHIEDMKLEEQLVPIKAVGFSNPNIMEIMEDLI
jgi:DNA-binding Lrp family transcriptional regulator